MREAIGNLIAYFLQYSDAADEFFIPHTTKGGHLSMGRWAHRWANFAARLQSVNTSGMDLIFEDHDWGRVMGVCLCGNYEAENGPHRSAIVFDQDFDPMRLDEGAVMCKLCDLFPMAKGSYRLSGNEYRWTHEDNWDDQ